jgi:hypothetical protein
VSLCQQSKYELFLPLGKINIQAFCIVFSLLTPLPPFSLGSRLYKQLNGFRQPVPGFGMKLIIMYPQYEFPMMQHSSTIKPESAKPFHCNLVHAFFVQHKQQS